MDEKPNPFQSPGEENRSPYFQQPPGPPSEPPAVGAPPEPDTGFGLAVAGMILGIISLPLLCACAPVSLAFAIPGFIMSMYGRQSTRGAGMALAGLICSGIGIFIGLAWSIFLIGAMIFGPPPGP